MREPTQNLTIRTLAMFLASAALAGCAAGGDQVAPAADVASVDEELGGAAGSSWNEDARRFSGHHGDRDRRNICPMVQAIAFPIAPRVGESTTLHGFALDEDRRPQSLSFQWTAAPADRGTIANKTQKTTSFTCKKEGLVTLTFSASDGQCTRKAITFVYCRPGSVPACGDGKLSGNETCDNSSSTKCPTAATCDDKNPCTKDVLTGDPAQCNVTCAHNAINTCVGGDSCCGVGADGKACTNSNDSDCPAEPPLCGNGKFDAGEFCDNSTPDHKCPTTCADTNDCTVDTLKGTADTCTARCENAPITTCSAQTTDKCCAPGCNANTDVDCLPKCNGVVEPGETCDPSSTCPTSCDDSNACTVDSMTGKPETCDVVCKHDPASCNAAAKDGCCPQGCTFNTDADCVQPPTCGNGNLDSGETCDNSSSTKCPASCDDNKACTTDTTSGSAGACTLACGHSPITACSATSDGCCNTDLCNANTDADCTPHCGNGAVESGETCDSGAGSNKPCGSDACDDGDPCTTDSHTGSAATCDLVCTHTPISSDSCNCGNGKLDQGETCDTKDAAHPCPTTCDDGKACTNDMLNNAGTCKAACSYTDITTPECLCGNGVKDAAESCDNSSPNAADKCPDCNDGNDCTTDTSTGSAAACTLVCTHVAVDSPTCKCGNGTLDSNESCDNSSSTKCPTSCDDGMACTDDSSTGSVAGCDFKCVHTASTTPACLCGNGSLDTGETCDNTSSTKCPTSCTSADACNPQTLSGSPDSCDVSCKVAPITTCVNGDQCCLASCNNTTAEPNKDNDCPPVSGGDPCNICETTTEGDLGDLCRAQLDLCDQLPGVTPTTIRGVPAGTPRNKLCRDILNCTHEKHCAGNGSGDCLCGIGADPNTCYAATANMTGPCADLVIAGVESEAVADITQRLPDTNYAAAQAFQVVDLCDALSCRDQCL